MKHLVNQIRMDMVKQKDESLLDAIKFCLQDEIDIVNLDTNDPWVRSKIKTDFKMINLTLVSTEFFCYKGTHLLEIGPIETVIENGYMKAKQSIKKLYTWE